MLLPNQFRAFLSWHRYLGPVQFDPTTYGMLPGYASDCPDSWPGLLTAGLQLEPN